VVVVGSGVCCSFAMVLEQLLSVISFTDIFFQSLLRTIFNKITNVDFLLKPVVFGGLAVSVALVGCSLLRSGGVFWLLVFPFSQKESGLEMMFL
jgi:hypothetical protein